MRKLHSKAIIGFILICHFILFTEVRCAEDITEAESRETQAVVDMVRELLSEGRSFRVESGRYPFHWNEFETQKRLPAGCEIQNIDEQSTLIFKDWRFVILSRNVYNDKYDVRENMAIAAFRAPNCKKPNLVVCGDSAIGQFFKIYPEDVKITIKVFCRVNEEHSIAGWTHIFITPVPKRDNDGRIIVK